MRNCVVRFLDMIIKNLKNVNNGNISFKNNVKVRKEFTLDKADVYIF